MEELKPCPFCKGEDIIIRFVKGAFYVQCADCTASIPSVSKNYTKEQAVEAWNTRK